eukprot:g16124.t1
MGSRAKRCLRSDVQGARVVRANMAQLLGRVGESLEISTSQNLKREQEVYFIGFLWHVRMKTGPDFDKQWQKVKDRNNVSTGPAPIGQGLEFPCTMQLDDGPCDGVYTKDPAGTPLLRCSECGKYLLPGFS